MHHHEDMLPQRVRLSPQRQTRVQFCVSPEERDRLIEQARADGFESVSSYVRARTLTSGRATRTSTA